MNEPLVGEPNVPAGKAYELKLPVEPDTEPVEPVDENEPVAAKAEDDKVAVIMIPTKTD